MDIEDYERYETVVKAVEVVLEKYKIFEWGL